MKKMLERKGVIPEGKYENVLSNNGAALVKKGSKVGVVDINAKVVIPIKFKEIVVDEAGNYNCIGIENGETIKEVYDNNFKRI